jgi:hypothetical protein
MFPIDGDKELKKQRKRTFFEILDIINLKREIDDVINMISFSNGEERNYFINIYRKWKKFRNAKRKGLLSGLLR